MARTVYFSFHYQRDIMRVQHVKQHYVTKESYTEAGYFDGSLEEKAKKEGDGVVQRLIDEGLNGSSVLCVLVGKETSTRHWVYYEILKSVELGMGIFGIRIHQLKHPRDGIDTPGASPFDFSGYSESNGKMVPMIKYTDGWKNAPYLTSISPSAALYLKGTDKPILSSLFKTYDWVNDDGYNNFSKWVEAAAKQAGR
ncbi:MAG TPA: TIR domain-containing protein [Candidatus Acidoferrales bacterium]|nr:TIR domain-containing protein [Candidatus Acidoferrales bacterium]